MHRASHLLLAIVLLGGCTPNRDANTEPPAESGSPTAWLVLTSVQGDYEWVSHQFMRWNGAGSLCTVMKGSYEAMEEANAAYASARDAFQDKWGDDYEASTQPEYRRQGCELVRSYSASNASAYTDFDNGRDQLYLNLYHPDGSDGSPVEGAYPLSNAYYGDDDDSAGGDDDGGEDSAYFGGGRTVYQGNYYEAYAAAMDCDAYAEDPKADMYPEIDYWDLIEASTISAGTLQATEESASVWHLTLEDGKERNQDGDETDLSVDASFPRCEITYESPSYAYDE